MPAPRSARHARSPLLVAVLALLALPAATAQAWPGLNGYMAYGSNRTGSQFSDDIYVSPLDVESPIRLTFRRASPPGRRTVRAWPSRPRRPAATSSPSSTPMGPARLS
jgi:hypothetical protein